MRRRLRNAGGILVGGFIGSMCAASWFGPTVAGWLMLAVLALAFGSMVGRLD